MRRESLDKIQIQQQLVRCKLYTKRCLYWRTPSDPAHIIQEIERQFGPNAPLVLRCSSKRTRLNLPRIMARNARAAARFVVENSPCFDFIAQDYFPVAYSLEIFVEGPSHFRAEIVPGIWETDNPNPPDVIEARDGDVLFHIFRLSRTCKFLNDHLEYVHRQRTMLRSRQYRRLYESISEKLPFIWEFCMTERAYRWLHGVCNRNYKWQFINARIGREPMRAVSDAGSTFHVVSTLADLDALPQKRCPVMFNLKTAREHTAPIMVVAAKLRKYTRIVYVTYGLLSHQAIVLRELGFEVRQAPINYRYIRKNMKCGQT